MIIENTLEYRALKETATYRLELLRRCASHLSFILADYTKIGAVYHPNISELTDLINELAKELEDGKEHLD